MKYLYVFLVVLIFIQKHQCEYVSCRTNCSTNGTVDNDCWRQALTYHSSELIERLFSFSSLSVYVDAYQIYHPKQLNDSMKLVDDALENHLLNESIDANLSINLFKETKQLLINFCRNLTQKHVTSVDIFPRLSCSQFTCSSDIRNYILLFIISTALCSLTFIIFIVQCIKMRRRTNSVVTVSSIHIGFNSSASGLAGAGNR